MAAESDAGAEAALPDEVVVTEILARLPAKSVGRFRCVCRGWSTMLSSDYFIDLHRQRANRSADDHPNPKLFLTVYGSSYDGYLYSWRRGPGAVVEKLMRDDLRMQEVITTTNPCRGLVLIRAIGGGGGGGYYVFNPSSGESLALPDTQVPFKMANKSSGWRSLSLEPPSYLRVSYGLGYCMTTNEYKVVRLFSNLIELGDDDVVDVVAGACFTPTRCEVFVFGTAAGAAGCSWYWRPSAGRPPVFSVMEANPGVFLDGHLHFLCSDGGIVTFSIGHETFGSLLPPAGFGNTVSVLTELDGRLCVCYGEPNSDDPLVLCVYCNDDEARHGWEKLCCVDRAAWPESERALLRSLWIDPLGVYYSADAGARKIMFGTSSCKVFAVDCNSGGDPEILLTPEDTIIGSCEDSCLPVIGVYEESLVPLGRHTVEDMIILSSPENAAWFNILKWLSARTLSELRLVCREWRGMITSDCFVRSHVVHANLKMKRSPHIMFIIDPSLAHYVHLEDCIRDPSLLMAMPPEFVVCSQPCHGLNVGSWSNVDFICNPIMRYRRQPLNFDDEDDSNANDDDETFSAGCIGLGYDTEIDEHVLVRIKYKEKNLETRSYELKCCKKSLNDEVWHPIDPPPRPVAAIQPNFVNGKIYWIVEPNLGPVSTTCEIVAFNVITEEFEILQGPPCGHGVGRMTILELYGSLCVSYSGQSRNTMDIWMMKDASIWSMEYHIVLDELSKKATPLVVDPTDGRILLNTGFSLGYYDPKTAAFETLIIVDDIRHYPADYEIYPIVCHESLVCPLEY